jgi:acyl dehydratase
LTVDSSNVEGGDEIPEWRMESVSRARMRTVAAILRDPNPIHWDPTILGSKGLGDRVINQGPICVGYIVNMLIAWAGPESIRRLRVGFPDAVYGDDCVIAGGRVTSVTREAGESVAECAVWLDRDDGTRTLEGTAWVTLTQS